ncbi:peptidoglycan bridge formation glycyltransferase FemA/FemB family protein [Patescibacteria group bacterium]|nr:peptidoglycan bridge formation glycyltransferase FemA/FemB family protein [Patescibacteria group bacterium]
MEDIRQTKEWGRYLESCGWVVDKVGDISVFIKKVPLMPFSMMKIQRFYGKLDFSDLKRVKRKYKVVYTVAEPMNMVVEKWKINTKPFLPTKTVIIDLSKNEKQLWSDLSKTTKQTLKKNNYIDSRLRGNDEEEQNDKKRHSGKLSLRNASRIRFYEAWKGSSKTWLMGEKRFNKLLDAFGEKASLLVSESEGEFLSGILLLKSKDTANYFQTWISEKGRESGAHYHLVWKVILECKKKGLGWFDFEGILDERWPQKKWAGFSRFKKKFGGKVVTYPGSFTKWF